MKFHSILCTFAKVKINNIMKSVLDGRPALKKEVDKVAEVARRNQTDASNKRGKAYRRNTASP